ELAHVVHDSARPAIRRKPDAKEAKEDEFMMAPGEVEVPDPGTLQTKSQLYPWQYPKMREVSYPQREQALTDFLRTYAEMDIDKGVMPVEDVTADEITAERESLKAQLKETDDALKPIIKAGNKDEALESKWKRIKND